RVYAGVPGEFYIVYPRSNRLIPSSWIWIQRGRDISNVTSVARVTGGCGFHNYFGNFSQTIFVRLPKAFGLYSDWNCLPSFGEWDSGVENFFPSRTFRSGT